MPPSIALEEPRQPLSRIFKRIPPWPRAVLLIVGVLLAIRVVLPYALTWGMNNALARPGPFQGHIEGLSLALWRGAYVVHGLHVEAHDRQGEPTLTFSADAIDIAVDWRQLLHARINSSLVLKRPRLSIRRLNQEDLKAVATPSLPDSLSAAAGSAAAGPPGVDERWQDRVDAMIAFTINTMRIEQGEINFRDDRRDVDFHLAQFNASLKNLAGGQGHRSVPTSFIVDGQAVGEGRLHLNGSIEPWATAPTFALNAAVENLHLVALNPSTKHLNGLAFNRGVFSAYAEVQAADNRLDGYIKPMFIDLDVATFGDGQGGPATELFWRAAIVVAENILPNGRSEVLAARIPIHGRFDDPDTDVWTILISTLANAFLSPIMPGFDGIDRYTVKE